MQNLDGAVIACAGMGTRIGLGMPKCMIEIGGQTILSRLIHTLQSLVPVIHVVVGYREDMVIDYCSKYHRDVVLVRNQEFRNTRAAFSLSKGARFMGGKILFLDGDLLIAPDSLKKFAAASLDKNVLVGLTEAKTENAVFAHGEPVGDLVKIETFSREQKSPYEWANVVTGPSDLLNDATGFVFERLLEHAPLEGFVLELAEIDTSGDFEIAKQFLQDLEAKTAS